MCIRDSDHAEVGEYIKKHLASAGADHDIFQTDNLLILHIPVSYTHLDVYKRQELYNGKRFRV